MKVIGFFIFIYGWFSLYDSGLSIEGVVCLLGGMLIVGAEEILSRIEWRRFKHDE